MKYLATVFSALIVGLFMFTGGTAAQNASPVAPDPALCTLTPPSYEEIARLAATPAAEPVPDTASTPTAALPAGEPVDAATREAVEQSMIINVACLNSGSTLLWMAVYTDHALASIINGTGEISQELYDSLATPEAMTPEDQVVIVAFDDMVMLPDGRVAAIITGANQSDGVTESSSTLFYLAEKDGHWYIDDYVNPE